MLEQTYSKWLEKEAVAIKYALLVAIEKRDNLLYIEEPALREEYMQKIGVYEEQVLKAELEVALAEKKKQLIQTAINRREPVDLEAIENLLDAERKQQVEKLNQNYKRDSIESKLSPEEKDELQKLYKEIVRDFHPEVHKELTEFQKQLYKRALSAYQKQQLEELRLVHEMLYVKDTEEFTFEIPITAEVEDGEPLDIVEQLMADYSLAAEVFECFETLEEDGVLLGAKQRYEVREQGIRKEIENIQSRFPFIAKETLHSEELTDEYLKSLEIRMNSCLESIKKLEDEIREMLGA